MHTDLTLARWAHYAAGGVMMAVAVIAGGLSLTLNVAHGLETGLAAGIAFGLADIGKIVIPIVAGAIGWSRQMRLTAAICVAVSLWCAINYYADRKGRELLAREHGQTVYADAEKHIAELGTEADRLSSLAAEEARRGGCGPNCRAVMNQAASARQRLEAARSSRAALTPSEVSGLAAIIAAVTCADTNRIARGIGAVKAVMFLALIEALVWLSMPAMALLAMAMKAHDVAAHDNTTPALASATARPLLRKSAASGTRAYYLQRLEREHPALANRVRAGELSVYRACILAGFRKPAKDWSKPEACGIKAGRICFIGDGKRISHGLVS